MKLDDDPKLIFIRLISILYVTMFYVIFGIVLSYFLDEYGFHDLYLNNNDSSDSIPQLIFEIGLVVGIISCFAFFGRHIVQLIPFPLDSIMGFDYETTREVAAGAVLFVFMFNFSSTLAHKFSVLKSRLNEIKTKHKYDINDISYFTVLEKNNSA